MKPSPLLLEGSFIEDISFSFNQEFDLSGDNKAPDDSDEAFGKWGLASNVAVSKVEGQESKYGIRLHVSMGKENVESVPPYILSVTMIGFFSLRDPAKHKDKMKFVYSNGAAVLYGSVREIIYNLSARAPYVPLLLPAAMFIPSEKISDTAE